MPSESEASSFIICEAENETVLLRNGSLGYRSYWYSRSEEKIDADSEKSDTDWIASMTTYFSKSCVLYR
jgi:hypothetical protein